VLTLYTTPVVYLFFDRLATRFKRHEIATPEFARLGAGMEGSGMEVGSPR
jgi:hypothetical protein